jgi:hypothetical protein
MMRLPGKTLPARGAVVSVAVGAVVTVGSAVAVAVALGSGVGEGSVVSVALGTEVAVAVLGASGCVVEVGTVVSVAFAACDVAAADDVASFSGPLHAASMSRLSCANNKKRRPLRRVERRREWRHCPALILLQCYSKGYRSRTFGDL